MSSNDVLSKDDDSKDGKEGSPPDSSGLRNRGTKGRRSSTAESIANAVAKKVPIPLRPVVVRFISSLSLSLLIIFVLKNLKF